MHSSRPCLSLLVIRSPDIERAVHFYQTLGLLFTRHSHGSGPQHYTSETSGIVFEIYPLTPQSQPTTATRIGFRVDAVDEIIPRLVHIGAQILTPPTDSEWGRRAVVKDLDGHIVELLTSPPA